MIEQVFMAVIASMLYAGSMYLKKHYGPNAEGFDMFKFGATLATGVFVGFMMGFMGVVPTELGVVEQLGMYAGLTSVVQVYLQMLYKWVSGQ